MDYFFDTYAIVEISKKSENYRKFFEETIVTSILNMGEIYYYFLRVYDKEEADRWKNKLQNVIPVSLDLMIEAAKFRFVNKTKNFSFADCVGYVLAKELGLIFLTGDKAFKGLPNVEFVK